VLDIDAFPVQPPSNCLGLSPVPCPPCTPPPLLVPTATATQGDVCLTHDLQGLNPAYIIERSSKCGKQTGWQQKVSPLSNDEDSMIHQVCINCEEGARLFLQLHYRVNV
jgi:hypothetical protein